MARIPDANFLQAPHVSAGRALADVSPAAAAVQWEAMAQTGQQISNLGAALRAQREAQEKFHATAAYNDYTLQRQQQLEEAKRTAEPGAPEFTKNWQASENDERQKFVTGLPESQRQDFAIRTQQDASQRTLHAQQWQYKQADEKVENDVLARTSTHYGIVSANPELLPEVKARGAQELSLAPLPPAKKADLLKKFEQEADEAAVKGALTKGVDPRELAKKVSQTPEVLAPQAPEDSAAPVPPDGTVIQTVPAGPDGAALPARPLTYAAPSGQRQPVTEQDRDAITRAVYGEARGETPDGWRGVAWVIRNRVAQGGFGHDPLSVLTKPGQFEAVANGQAARNIPPKEYAAIRAEVDAVLDGKVADPTKGATYYYSPDVQGKLGRAAPKWVNEFQPSAEIGTHKFFADPKHPVPADGDQAKGADPGGFFHSPGIDIKYRMSPTATYGQSATAKAEPFKGIVVHSTGDDKAPATDQVAYGHRRDAERGGAFGYHFYIDRDGTIIQGAPMDKRTNHIMPLGSSGRPAEGITLENKNAVGVSFIGTEGNETPQQVAAFRRLAGALGSTYGFDPHASTFGHGELQGNKQASEGMRAVHALREGKDDPVRLAQAGEYTMTDVPFPSLPYDRRQVLIHKLHEAGRPLTEKEVSDGVAHIEQFGYAPKDEQGRTALDRAAEYQMLTPMQLNRERVKWQAAKMKYDASANIANMSEQQYAEHRENWIPTLEDTESMKAKAAAFRTMEKKWDKVREERLKDPAASVNSHPLVQQVYKESKQAGQMARSAPVDGVAVEWANRVMSPQEAHRKLIDARMEAQAQMGIEPALRQPISKDEAIRLLGMGPKPGELDDKRFTEGLKAAAAKAQRDYGPELGSQVFDSAVHQVLSKNAREAAPSFVRKIAAGEAMSEEEVSSLRRLNDQNLPAMARFSGVVRGAVPEDYSPSGTWMADPAQAFMPRRPVPNSAQVNWLADNATDLKAVAAFDAQFGEGTARAILEGAMNTSGVTSSIPPQIPDTRPWYQRMTSSPKPATGYAGGSTRQK